MQRLNGIRRVLFKLRKRLRKLKRPVSPPILDGVPDELDQSILDSIIQQYVGEQAAIVRNQHLSAWKSTGAYRIFVTTSSGREVRLIFKEAVYSFGEIPALKNFPARPGPPEYSILCNNREPLAKFLPKVFLVEELEPDHRYRYILEDLETDYERPISPQHIQRAAGALPLFQAALCTWADSIHPDRLIEYGREFSRQLQQYTADSLHRFGNSVEDQNLKEVLNNWKAITNLHLQPEFFAVPTIPVHGDSNYSNLHMHKHDLMGIKFVDWEWAGFGSPFADLASLLKGENQSTEEICYSTFIKSAREQSKQQCGSSWILDLSPKQCDRLYHWCRLERGLMDAGFLASQHLDTAHRANFSLPQAVTQSLQRVLRAYRQLAG